MFNIQQHDKVEIHIHLTIVTTKSAKLTLYAPLNSTPTLIQPSINTINTKRHPLTPTNIPITLAKSAVRTRRHLTHRAKNNNVLSFRRRGAVYSKMAIGGRIISRAISTRPIFSVLSGNFFYESAVSDSCASEIAHNVANFEFLDVRNTLWRAPRDARAWEFP